MEIRSWEEFFVLEKDKSSFKKLEKFLDNEYKNKVIFPPRDDVFNAFKLTPLKSVKVVIFGQDPYPNEGEAMGLAFSVNKGVKVPPSLRNIYLEIIDEYGLNYEIPTNGDLTYLAKQGVLLLNSILTCEAHKPLSHNNELYLGFFKDVIEVLNKIHQPVVFLLWGTQARKLKKYLNNPLHLVIETNHPSPLSANRGGWFKSGCFKKANEFLEKEGISQIDWFPTDVNEKITLF